jgi:hypothetical protein
VKYTILALALASTSFGGVILTMDEVGFQPINGLAVVKGGVTFNFTDSSGADYDSDGPGQETFVQDPSIEGLTAGETVGITFSQAFPIVQFGLALSSMSPVSSMATVSLYNGSTLVLTATFDSSLTDLFAEGLFSYSGAPVTGVTITPASSAATGGFALDNFEVTTPEPSTFSMLAGAGLALGAGILKRRKKA